MACPLTLSGMPRVGDGRDGQGEVLSEIARRLAHMLPASGAVQANHIHAQVDENVWSGDIGAQQHPPACPASPAPGWARRARLVRRGECPRWRRAPQDILAGLDDQQINAASISAAACSRKIGKLLIGDVVEGGVVGGGQHARRPNRPATKRGLVGRAVSVGGGGPVARRSGPSLRALPMPYSSSLRRCP